MKTKVVFLSLLFFITMSLTHAQNNNSYGSSWKKIEEFEKKSLPASALKEVDVIFNQAVKDKNNPQVIKALIHRMKFQSEIEDNAWPQLFSQTEKLAVESTDKLEQAMLHSLLAEMYMQYYIDRSYLIMQRTTITGYIPENMDEWSGNIFIAKSFEHIKASLLPATELKNTQATAYADILILGEDSRTLRPTLFDFVAYRALDLLSKYRELIARDFPTKDIPDEYFGKSVDFISLNFKDENPTSLNQTGIEIYQQLLKIHSSDTSKDAFLYADLERLEFVRNGSVSSNADFLYLQALDGLKQQYANLPVSVEIMIKEADYYSSSRDTYIMTESPLVEAASDEAKLKNLTKVRDICKEGIAKFPQYPRVALLKNKLMEIEQPALSCVFPPLTYPNKPIEIIVHSCNLEKATLKIYKIDKAIDKFMSDRNNNIESTGKLVYSQSLVLSNNLISQDTTFTIDGLDNGIYQYEITSDAKVGKSDKGALYISKFALLKRTRNNKIEYYVVDSESGQPVRDATLKIFESKYLNNKNIYNYLASIPCDANGYAPYFYKNNANICTTIEAEGDNSFPLSSTYAYVYKAPKENDTNRTIENITILTDRNIYRPGQTVYFKGICFNQSTAAINLIKNKTYKVQLMGAGDKEISSKSLTTNEFGSFAGEFMLPENATSTYFSIFCNGKSIYSIQVEEYKRPSIEITFSPVKETFALGDTVVITGNVMNYAGYPAAGATLKYNITEQNQLFRIAALSPKTFANGTVTTNENGNFSVSFVTKAEKKGMEKVYIAIPNSYNLTIEATDEKGETQQNNIGFTISSQSIMLNATSLSWNWEKKYLKKEDTTAIQISAVNTFHQAIKPMVDYRVFEVLPNQKIGDTTVVVGKQLLAGTIDLTKTTTIEMDKLRVLPSGKYRLVLSTKDSKGREATFKTEFVLYSEQDKTLPTKEYFFVHDNKITFSSTEEAEILIGTSADNAKILYELSINEKTTEAKWLDFNNELRLVKIPYKAEYGPEVKVLISMVKDGKYFNHSVTITKKEDSNRELDVKFTSFRDKLLPGQQETWTVKIVDKQGKTVNAELLATLYDASLDVFGKNTWYFSPQLLSIYKRQADNWEMDQPWSGAVATNFPIKYLKVENLQFDMLNWFGGYFGQGRVAYRNGLLMSPDGMPRAVPVQTSMKQSAPLQEVYAEAAMNMVAADEMSMYRGETGAAPAQQGVQIRKDFSETAFFYPQLKTNKDGEVLISFTIPESLTRWNFMGLAHTAELQYGQLAATTVTQKPFMITANMPRFVRVNDKLMLTATIANLTDKAISGQALLEILNPVNEEVISQGQKTLSFNVDANTTTTVTWEYDVTNQHDMLIFRLTAQNNEFSDGEQHLLPVLSNKVMITESMPINVRGKGTFDFAFDRMKNAQSSTLENKAFTVEYTNSPIWYAVQALPYMSTPSSDNALSFFSAYYINSLASYIANSNPTLQVVYEQWKKQDNSKEALKSNLDKNTELKNILLEETPWVLDARKEGEQKQQIAMLFEANNLRNNIEMQFNKLKGLQLSSGAFPWFNGMGEDRYVTLQVMDGVAKLNSLDKNVNLQEGVATMQQSALKYLDVCLKDDFERLKKSVKNYNSENYLSSIQIYSLYVRALNAENTSGQRFWEANAGVSSNAKSAYQYYFDQMKKYWTKQELYEQALIAVIMVQVGEKQIASDIINSLRERSKTSDEMGMYWDKNRNGYYWNQSAIRTQSTLIEAFAATMYASGSGKAAFQAEIDNMKIWLLRQKQTQMWESDITTVNVLYALLSNDRLSIGSEPPAVITVGGKALDEKTETGTGYLKKTYQNSEITPTLANISVTKQDDGIAWGAAYWQYLENIDKVERQATSLSVDKKLFIERATGNGKTMEPVTDKSMLKIGDKVIVRLTIRVDADMEYVCLKDLRGACFEPVEQLSGYRSREGLGYYQSTKDASMQYFFNRLPKGSYVLEYGLWVSRMGDYSNGMSTIQCQYAPEFVGHSSSERVVIK